MNFILKLIEKYRQARAERNAIVATYTSQLDAALNEINIAFSRRDLFIDPIVGVERINHYRSIINNNPADSNMMVRKACGYREMHAKYLSLGQACEGMRRRISWHNEQVARARIGNARQLLENVEGRQLDDQQMICVLKDINNHLVIAGAGTGKTTTIVGKIKYLLKTGQCKPEEILVLSFTNASATEMAERIRKETGYPIEASTFHKLGMNIITATNGMRPNITQLQLKKFVKQELERNMQSEGYKAMLGTYLLFHRVETKSEFDFGTKREYEEYLLLNPPITLQKEQVKSYGELDIANFLLQNGICYNYEQPYKIDTRTSQYSQYKPDFYLPEYDIYIEYFGINRQGEVPTFFNNPNGMTASQAYQNSMEWKRNLHRTNATCMVECFAYEKMEGTLLNNLREKLVARGVVLHPMSTEEMWTQLETETDSILEGVINLFETLINLLKSNNCDIATLRERSQGKKECATNNLILNLLEPIYRAYCNYLCKNDEIDFNDMIYSAISCVKEGRFQNPFQYVIVDEYQDISKARFLLLNSLRESNYFKLFCVGDDWQSIYRFAGSDIKYILDFEHYWGPTEISKIETTYRFSQELAEVTGRFVMKNPKQIGKSIRGMGEFSGFPVGVINGFLDKNAIQFMLDKLNYLPNGSKVFFVGRYSHDIGMLKESGELQYSYDNVNKQNLIHYWKRPDLDMSFITAHGSKGLQADYVFILNNKKTRMGFPSKIQDAAILRLLLDGYEEYPFAEERRLFYVAMTRAKKKVYLLTLKDKESDFAKEIQVCYQKEIKEAEWTCPLCGGRLFKRSGKNGEFYGCSNYREKGCKYTRNVR